MNIGDLRIGVLGGMGVATSYRPVDLFPTKANLE
jgi:hypothetical protein